MRIAYVGNFTRHWCTEVHVAESLTALGHDVVQLQENTVNWLAIPRLLRARRCEMLLWTRTWECDVDAASEALHVLKTQGVPTASFHLDRWLGLEREYQLDSEPFFRTDVVFSPDGTDPDAFVRRGIEHVWMPPGVLERECLPAAPDRERYPHDVVFVGSHPYPHPKWAGYRHELIERLREHYGDRFKVHPENGRAVRGRELAVLYASAKVVIGDSCLVEPVARYWSDRVPETLGRGGVLVHPEVEGLNELYPELPTYPIGRFDLLLGVVDELLDDPERRAALSESQRELVLSRDTYRHRMASLVDEIEKRSERGRGSLAHASGVVDVTHKRLRVRASFDLDRERRDWIGVREVWHDDTYELGTDELRDAVVLDLGANIGALSLLAARCGARRVLAVEPHPETLLRLVSNIERNGVGGIVEPMHAAVLDVDEGFVQLAGDGVTAHVVDEQRVDLPLVPCTTLDALVQYLGCEIDVLKIDCEGSEYAIIGGASAASLASCRRLVMEFHGPAQLDHVAPDDGLAFGALVTRLSHFGRVRIIGRPTLGGLLWWERY